MITSTVARKCQACQKPLHGRTDKKFCNDYCRNTYNNGLKSGTNPTVRRINGALLKNRRILESVLGGEEIGKVPREELLQQGFQFRYGTHTYTNKKGNVYFFCYEYGYLPLENNVCLVVKRKEG